MRNRIINPYKIYNAVDVAKVLEINVQTALDLIRSGKIVGQKIRGWKISGRAIENFLLLVDSNSN